MHTCMHTCMHTKKLYRIIHAREKGKNGGQKEECDKIKYVFYLFWFGEFIVHRLMHVNVLYYHKNTLTTYQTFQYLFSKTRIESFGARMKT